MLEMKRTTLSGVGSLAEFSVKLRKGCSIAACCLKRLD